MKHKLLSILLVYVIFSTTLIGSPLPNISAEGAILIEPNTNQILYSKNINEIFYPASMTKILTSWILINEMTDSNAILSKSLNSVNQVPSDSSHIGLRIDDSFTYLDGIYAILMCSDNFVSHDMGIYNANSTEAFANKMNQYAINAGAVSSNFVNAHGYHDPNHYTTPYDMSQIARYAFNIPLLTEIAGTHTYSFGVINRGLEIPLKHTAPLLDPESELYNPSVVAAKTGFHTPAGRTLVGKAVSDDIELIAVVMKTESPYQFIDFNNLVQYGFDNFRTISIDGQATVENISYSDWAKPSIDAAIKNNWIPSDMRNFQSHVTEDEFIFIMNKAIGLDSSTTFYTPIFTSPKLDKLKPLTRGEAACLLYEYINPVMLTNCKLFNNILFTDIYNLTYDQITAISTLSTLGFFGPPRIFFEPFEMITYEEMLYVAHHLSILSKYSN